MEQTIPGVLRLVGPRVAPLPLLLDSPHSGYAYPADFSPSAPPEAYRRGEDMFIDEIFGLAPEFGATLVAALFPRVYIDANRDEKDIDPELLDRPWPYPVSPSIKTRDGKGLIWRLVGPDSVPLYARKLTVTEVESRIVRYHRPYHDQMRRSYEALYGHFGAVWHVNCHSMGAVGDARAPDAGKRRADIVLGDRDGTTCSAEFTQLVANALRKLGYWVKINDPYKGVELVRRFSDPARKRHSLQIEINRGLYMDEAKILRGPGFDKLQRDLGTLLDAVIDFARRQ